MSTPKLGAKRDPMTREQAVKAINAVTPDFELEDWQKVVLLGFLTGMTPVRPGRARQNSAGTVNARIFQALDRIEEARTHGLA